MAETNAQVTEKQAEQASKTSFKDCLEIYIDSLEEAGNDDGTPVYKFRDGVTREGLQKAMKKSDAGINTTLPTIKKFLHYGATTWRYKDNVMPGVGEGSLQQALGMARGKFLQFCDEQLAKPASERIVQVVEPGPRFPDFTGQRASGLKDPKAFQNIFSKLQGLSKSEPAPKEKTEKAATEK